MISFIPGPSELYFTTADHMRRAMRDGVASLSHRSKAFESIYRETAEGLHTLLKLPDDYRIAFTGSATEIWERSVQSLVERKSLHYVNGAFSKRFQETAFQLGKDAQVISVNPGEGFETAETIHEDAELVALTHNETSTGTMLEDGFMQQVRFNHPDAIVIMDAVSSLPYPLLDYRLVDSVFFSVQKGFGLPAGLGVWMYNSRCLDKTMKLQADGKASGSYHSLISLDTHARKYQTPETPNVLAIYLLGKVVRDFLFRGIDLIRNDTTYKAAVLYQVLDDHPLLKSFVKNPDHRSATVITVDSGERTVELAQYLQSKGLQPGDGYGPYKDQQLRFANFPAHSKEVYHVLADALNEFR